MHARPSHPTPDREAVTRRTLRAGAQLEIRLAAAADRQPLRRMMELYLHDFSEFDGEDLDEHGLFGYSSLDYFWHEPSHAAYVFRMDGRYAGFALVNDDVIHPGSDFWMAEFFVLRKYRKQGVGGAAAHDVLGRHRGRWEVGQRAENPAARSFWRATIAAYTAGRYREVALDDDAWRGTVQLFESAAPGEPGC